MELTMQVQENSVALPLRSYTILGVCQAIGEDFGFNPVLLRVPFAATVLISPLWAIVAYFVLGAVVLASRLLFPKAKIAVSDATGEHPAAANEQREMASAA
jgi:phage shock protein PspC (stress-responsive transcriptional regulator)